MQDSICQTTHDLSNNTPRKTKQRKVIHTQRQKIHRLQAALKKKKPTRGKEETLQEALNRLPEDLAHFVKMQLELHSRKKKGRRYSPQMKSIAVSLYHASGKAYRVLSKLFILPTKSSLRRYISRMPAATGISQGALNIIKKKLDSMNELEKLCTLCMDEVSLKTNLYYDITKDMIVGLEDFGSGARTNKVANQALVILLRSISGEWKQPLGYALVNGGCPREEMELMKNAIDKVEGIGLNVVVILSDMESNFQSLAQHLGVTPERPWFMHNNKKYFLMFDPPYLMKCVRNNLMKYTFKFGNYTAQWKDIVDFYNRDKELDIRAAPKFTEKHIRPNNFCKMKVKYATQILSHTVAASLCTYVSIGGLATSAMGTAQLLFKFDSLFDCVNVSTINSPKELKRAMTTTSSHQGYLEEAFTFIKELKVFERNEEVTGRIKCLKGWLVTIKAILSIWDQLHGNYGFKFLLTRRLNTDPIENFFGSIRQQGGNSDNPTPIQFTRAFRKLFFSSFLNSSTGNCAEDFDNLLAQFAEAKSKKKSNVPIMAPVPKVVPHLDIGTVDYRENEVSENLLKENPIAYVSGYLLRKCFKLHECSTCRGAMVTEKLDDSRNLLCFFKEYEGGGLLAPTASYLQYVIQLEDLFVKDFSMYTKSVGVGKSILTKLQDVPVSFHHCPEFPFQYLLKLFLRMRIYYSIKFANRNLSCKNKNKKSKKYIKITHL